MMSLVHVDPRRPEPAPGISPPPRRRVRPSAPPTAAPAPPPDSVSISQEARSLAASRQAVEAAPDVRSDRVAELKQRIASGEYTVPADVLARALLKEDRG